MNAMSSEPDPQPDVLIISCSTDRDHRDLLVPEALSFQANKPNSDFADPLVISLPGAFPYPDNYDDIADLLTQFPIGMIAVITHSDCGVTRALEKKIHDPSAPGARFDKKTNAIIREWAAFGAKPETLKKFSKPEIAKSLAELVACKIAIDLTERTRTHDFENPDGRYGSRLKDSTNFDNILIGAYVSNPKVRRPEFVIAPTQARDIARTIYRYQTQSFGR